MPIIEVNLAGFQFTCCVPDVPGSTGRYAWQVSRVHHAPRIRLGRRMRWWAPRPRIA
jgi:hypothetical protein